MCTSNSFGNSLVPYGLKIQAPYPVGLSPGAALELQRSQAAAQLYDYGARIRLGLHYAAAAAAAAAAGHHPPPAPGFGPYHHGPDPLALMYAKHCDPRLRFLHEEPKPSHSYIGLIAMAILSSKENKMVLSDIYQWILDNYAYFRTRGPGWRNSIRHNLSLNDCFVKAGRSANGKGHYWAIHPANVDDFRKGDFRRRRAQRKVRKAMGLAVPEDDEDSPSPPPAGPQNEPAPHAPGPASIHWAARVLGSNVDQDDQDRGGSPERGSPDPKRSREGEKEENTADGGTTEEASDGTNCEQSAPNPKPVAPPPAKRRMFDVDSLLAPDKRDTDSRLHASLTYYGRPLPPSLPHPGFLPHGHHLLPPGSHLLQRDMAPNHLQQLHGDVGSPERSRTLAIDVGHQENEDAASPKGSPDRESRKRPLSCGDNNSSGGESDPSRSRGESPGSGSGSRMTAVSRADSPVSRMTSWIPMMGGSWKDHPSAFRSTMPHGHRLVWGQLGSGSGQVIWGQLASGSSASQTMSGAGLLRIPPPPPGPR